MALQMVLINEIEDPDMSFEFVGLIHFESKRELVEHLIDFYLENADSDGFIVFENGTEVCAADDSIETAAKWLLNEDKDDQEIPF